MSYLNTYRSMYKKAVKVTLTPEDDRAAQLMHLYGTLYDPGKDPVITRQAQQDYEESLKTSNNTPINYTPALQKIIVNGGLLPQATSTGRTVVKAIKGSKSSRQLAQPPKTLARKPSTSTQNTTVPKANGSALDIPMVKKILDPRETQTGKIVKSVIGTVPSGQKEMIESIDQAARNEGHQYGSEDAHSQYKEDWLTRIINWIRSLFGAKGKYMVKENAYNGSITEQQLVKVASLLKYYK